ncbi:MAG: methylated-DNA--[protein]-cysteine S-methyltransferase [Candidatus Methanoperedens sp.]|nr:methylated-DNA--[protein]-cysteine S-methyltransferase [Candidatus Methanoperedens sp.]
MMKANDIIFAEAIGCYIEIGYGSELRCVRFIKSKERLKEKKTRTASFELDEYFKGKRTDFSCAVDLSGLSPFAQKVLSEARNISYGRTVTYSELAERIGSRAFRAVGRALAINPAPIVIPCHRVVARNGMGGFSAGVDIKIRLLELEQKMHP